MYTYFFLRMHENNNYLGGCCSKDSSTLEKIIEEQSLCGCEIEVIYFDFDINNLSEYYSVFDVDENDIYTYLGQNFETRKEENDFIENVCLSGIKNKLEIKTIEIIK